MTYSKSEKEQALNAPGTWESNITASHVASGSKRIADIRCANDQVFWLESLASEKGRMTIMQNVNGEPMSILPQPFNVRSKAHEYGGAPYCIGEKQIYFVNADDQAIYRLDLANKAPPELFCHAADKRFADLIWIEDSAAIVAVCEDHQLSNDKHHEPKNYLVHISSAGDLSVIKDGADFYAYPRYCSLNKQLCWISWQHPNMPWDQTELWLGKLLPDGTLSDTKKLLGNDADGSTVQPTWNRSGELYCVNDRDEWWNIQKASLDDYEASKHGASEHALRSPIRTNTAEYATPLWVFGMQNYALLENGILASYTRNGLWHLEQLDMQGKVIKTLDEVFASVESVCSDGSFAYFIASTPSEFAAVFQLNLQNYTLTQLSAGASSEKAEISIAESLYFDISDEENKKIHAFYYPPFNSEYELSTPPPLIVLCHGGPTGQTSSELNYKVQYWTNRGFAVVDINYRGSTGFGRSYRRSLYKNWGIYDVEDMKNVVDALIAQGKAAEAKVIIKGSSAGGFTVLAALTFTERFNAGVSLYGIGDLELLARDTHKFEKHYLDQLIGPYPQDEALYKARSPINSVHKLNCPLILFQGLEDKVVPPNQAREMAASVNKKKIPVALVEFEDEGHGFRSPENIQTMLEAELYFYQRVFKLCEPAVDKPIQILNMDS